MAKITGIGGVFFKARIDKKVLAEWYGRVLGMPLEVWGAAILRWPDDTAEDKGCTVWSPADNDTDWFSPSSSPFMINFRIDNMDEMLKQLQENLVEIVKGPETHENGRFIWILDLDGNKVELWEPKIWHDKDKFKG